MADITMCMSNCTQQCYRKLAQPNPLYQSYSDLSEVCNEENGYVEKLEIREGGELV